MFVITVDFRIEPGHIETFRQLVTENARISLSAEPGCLQFDVCIDPAQAEAIFLYEVYEDRAAFDAHLSSVHFRHFDTAVKDMVASKVVRAIERISPA